MMISIVVPAFNEEQYLPETLAAITVAAEGLEHEVIVVDNESTDATGVIAVQHGARVVSETVHNIAAVRNRGARSAKGDVLIFVDADTQVPPRLLPSIASRMTDPGCCGGAVAVTYPPFRRKIMSWYVRGWKPWERLLNMKQGAAQFCRKDVFESLGGYDDRYYLGEDIDFYWRLSRHARTNGGHVAFITDMPVTTSTRRFDKMSLWKTFTLTNPILILLNWKRASVWKDWYEVPTR